MENISVKSPTAASESSATYTGALAVLTTLFFMWGSLTSLNDVLIPYVQHVFKIELAASMLIQTACFSAYFVFSIPAAKIIDWIGYKRAIVVGLLTMIVACLAFFPAAKIPSFPFFLAALIILATGITILQVAANPYVAVLGKPQTASSRLNLTQAFNSLGTTIFPWIGAHLILRTTATAMAQSASQAADAVIKLYVYFFAAALALLAIGIGLPNSPRWSPQSTTSVKRSTILFGSIPISSSVRLEFSYMSVAKLPSEARFPIILRSTTSAVSYQPPAFPTRRLAIGQR